MINLTSIASLPLSLELNTLQFDPGASCKSTRIIHLKKLIPALLNKSLKYPENVYEENDDVCLCEDRNMLEDKSLHYEVIVLPAGLLGIEFIRSHIYYSQQDGEKKSCIIECLYGIATLIIQKNAPKEDELDIETSVDEGIMIKLRKGEKAEIPSGYFYTFINTRNTPVIISRIFKKKGVVDYRLLEIEQGMAYYAIRKNARVEVVFNPRYKSVPKLDKYTPDSERFRCKYATHALYESMKKDINYYIENLVGY